MKSIINARNRQSTFFLIGILLFIIIAFIGWEKLQYGFNFIDEGYYMTEGWRLTVGDNFLKDKFTGALKHYTVFNAIIFSLFPEITLLDFRKLEFSLTILCLLFFSVALYRVDKQYWYQPYIFSLFAFTGLDGLGMITNLSYQTYPHLFLVLHITSFLSGIYSTNGIARKIFFLFSGLFLWCISFSLLHLSVIIVSPVIIYLISNKSKIRYFSFSMKDLMFVLIPFLTCWIVFIAIYHNLYITNVITSLQLLLSSSSHSMDSLTSLKLPLFFYLFVTSVILMGIIFFISSFRIVISIILVFLTSVLIFYIIVTSFGGTIELYWGGMFKYQIWFVSILISWLLLFWINILKKLFTKKEISRGEEISLVLLTPSTVLFMSMSLFSGLGILTILQCAIPFVAAITLVFLHSKPIIDKSYIAKFMVIIFFFLPFYITTALADWKFTFYDVAPEHAKYTIESGFAKNIKTNNIYKRLYEWIEINTETYTKDGDFMISYIVTPMVYVITKRRPALDESFIPLIDCPRWYLDKSIDYMKSKGRNPAIAFVFETMPAIVPIPTNEGKYSWWPFREFIFSEYSGDPISQYILKEMTLVSDFTISGNDKIRCFIDNNIYHAKKINLN